MQEIEGLLKNSHIQFGNIKRILISREGSPSQPRYCNDGDGPGKIEKKFDSKFVSRRFNYTCIGVNDNNYNYGRYIDLKNNFSVASSLLVHHGGHHDHLHVEYNELIAGAETPRTRTQILEHSSNLDVTHFRYLIDLSGQEFRIEPLEEFSERYSSSMILARLQDGTDITDPDNVVLFGKWLSKDTYSEWDIEFRPFGKKYLYLVEVDRESGGCIGMKNPIELDFGSESSSLSTAIEFHAFKNGKSVSVVKF